jgi:recombinational DNA repair protein (RecF pathway)
MDEFGTEDLQALLQFFDLMLYIFFNGGKSMKTIADVNVHERLGIAKRSAQPSAF